MNTFIQTLIGLPNITAIMLKITIILLAGWIAHYFMARYNPRWRVIVWRCVIVGIFLVPALIPVKYLQIPVTRAPEQIITTETPDASESYNIINSPDIIVPSAELPPESEYMPELVSHNNSYTIQKSFSVFTWLRGRIWLIAMYLWIFISSMLLLRLLVGFVRIKRIICSSLPAQEHLKRLLVKVASDLNCRRDVKLKVSGHLHTPFLAGFLRPVIIIPEYMIGDEYTHETSAIMAHEITHLCSGDLFWTFAARVVGILLWFHPLVWKLRNVHDAACEEVCDAIAADYAGSAELYSSALARAALNIRGTVSTIGVIPMARSSNILIRLKKLKCKVYSSPLARRWVVLSVFSIMIVFIGLGGIKLAYAQQKQSDNDAKGDTIISSQKEYVYEGNLTFNKELPVGLAAGTSEHSELVKINSLSFEDNENTWGVFAKISWLPIVDSTWKIKVELLDREGKLLRYARDKVTILACKLSNSDKTTMQDVEMQLDQMSNDGRRYAARFRVTLEPVDDPLEKAKSADNKLHTINVTTIVEKDKKPLAGSVVMVDTYYLHDKYPQVRTLYKTDSQGNSEINLDDNELARLDITAQKQGFASIEKRWYNNSSSFMAPLVNVPKSYSFEMPSASEAGGVVRNNDGDTIEGVAVRISTSLRRPDESIYVGRCVLTDSLGRWKVENIPSDTDYISIQFKHPDYGGDNQTRRELRGQELLDAMALKDVVVLSKGITFSGVVHDDKGQAVPDATVMMSGRYSDPFYVITDSQGRFKFAASDKRNDYGAAPIIVVEAPGYASDSKIVDIIPNPEPLEFELSRGRNVKCHVVDSEGNPIAGALAAIEPANLLNDTDNNGDFIIPNVPNRAIRILVLKEGFVSVRNYVINPSQNEVTLQLKRAFKVQGTVTDAITGKSIPQFGIVVAQTMVNVNERPVIFTNGKYELSFGEPSRSPWKIYTNVAGYEEAQSEEFNVGEGTKVIDFKLIPGSSTTSGSAAGQMFQPNMGPSERVITGLVKDDKGQPVKDALIKSTVPFISDQTATNEIVTNAEGKFSFKMLMTGSGGTTMVSRGPNPIQETQNIFIRQKERNLASEFTIDDKKNNYEITLSPGVIFSGKVVDVNGAGIPKAQMSLGYFMTNRMVMTFPEPTIIEANGSFEIRAVLKGHKYSVSASADGYGQQSVQVDASETENEHINLEPMVLDAANLSVSGIVVDQIDQPIPNARIFALYGNGQPSGRETYTNTKGEFTIDKVCSGRITLQVQKEGPESLFGRKTANGGDKDIKIIVSALNSGRPVPRQPPSLINKSLPAFENIDVNISAEQLKDKRILICFWDMDQRPSRNCVQELNKKADELKQKNIEVIIIHVTNTDMKSLNDWIKEYNISFILGMIKGNEEQTKFNWGVKALPWLILTDKNGYVQAEGIDLAKLDEILQEIQPGKAEESKEGEILNMLYEASEKNKAFMKQGRIEAKVNYTYYDEKGKEDRKSENEVLAIFKGEKVRIEQKELNGERQTVWRAAATEERFIESYEGDPVACLRKPEFIERIHFYCHFLPTRNTAFGREFLKYGEEKLASRKIYTDNTDKGKAYVIDVVLKSRPKDLLRYVMAPDKAGSVLKFESYHDSGQGHILLRKDIADMQPTGNGGWYLRRFSRTGYREDGALRDKEEVEIKNFNFSFDVLDHEFTWEAIGVTKGMKIQDSQLGISYTYEDPKESTKESRDEIPKNARTILDSINKGKNTRDTFRNLYALMNKPAPNLEAVTWINSEPLKLEDLKGKIIVLDFWGIDCGPCLGDIEELNKIQERGKSEPVVVIGVHHPGLDISEIKKVMTKYNVKYPVCIDSAGGSEKYWQGRTFEKYSVSAIPRPFLIDIKGNIRSVASPVNSWELDDLIKEHETGIIGTSPSEPEWIVGLKAAPEKVSLVDLKKGQKIQKSVYIYKPDVPEFTVKIESEPEKPSIGKLVKYEQEGAVLYELIIDFAADFQGNNYSSQIKLITNDKNKPEIVIPITANIAAE